MYDDQPDWRLYFGTIENLYENHPVKIDIAGYCLSRSRTLQLNTYIHVMRRSITRLICCCLS